MEENNLQLHLCLFTNFCSMPHATCMLWWYSLCDELCYARICRSFLTLGSFKTNREREAKSRDPRKKFAEVVCQCAEIRANDIFLFFKNYFWHHYIKTIQKVQTILNFNNKKKFQNLIKHNYKHNTKQYITRCVSLTF